MANFDKEWLAISHRKEQIEALEQSKKKIDRLAAYLLSGRAVTGRIMIEKFAIYSYRDAIYDLKKRGYEISRKEVYSPNGVEHIVWWLSEYSEDFVRFCSKSAFI